MREKAEKQCSAQHTPASLQYSHAEILLNVESAIVLMCDHRLGHKLHPTPGLPTYLKKITNTENTGGLLIACQFGGGLI